MRRWLVLGANVYVQFITYGVVYSFGIFLPEISSFYGSGKGETSWIGSISASAMQLSGPLSALLTRRYGCRAMMCIGAVLAGVGLLASAFSSNIYTLYFTYGIILGTGGGLMTVSGVVAVTHCFQDKRSLALGIVFTGGSVGMSVIPILLLVLFDAYGWKMSLLILSGLVLNGVVCGAILQPIQGQENDGEMGSKCLSGSLLRNTGFICFVISAVLDNMGYYIPLFLLPEYALSLGLSDTEASSLVTSQGVAAIFARLFCGYIADKKFIKAPLINAVMPILDGIVIAMLQFTTTIEPLLVLSTLHGIFSALFSSLIAISLIQVVGISDLAPAYGIWLFSCGFGSLLGPPVAGWIYDYTGSYVIGFNISAVLCLASGTMILWVPIRMYGLFLHRRKKVNLDKLRTQDVFSITKLEGNVNFLSNSPSLRSN